jgi:chromosome condensin MukBEF MukE localization factor
LSAEANLIDLSKLNALTTVYQKLMSGFHITENNLILWQSLDQNLEAYQALFNSLGYTLIKDARGYFYFSTPDTTVTMTKTSRRIALFLYTLIEYWADKGYDPVAALFEQALNRDTFERLFNQNTSIFEQIDINSAGDIRNEIIKRMVRLGFAKEIGKEYKLLAPCYRYIDAVMELSDQFASTDPLADEETPSEQTEENN